MINNYIFDFGQVIVEFDAYKIMSPYVKDPYDKDLLAGILFARKYWDKLDDGTLTEKDVLNDVLSETPEILRENVIKIMDNWYKNLPAKEETIGIIKKLKSKGKKVFLLSNISKTFAEDYKNVNYLKEIFSDFDGMIFSGSIGKVKPSTDIFQYAIDEFGIKAEETLFIDDNQLNVDAAQSVGIKAFLFKNNYVELRKELGIT